MRKLFFSFCILFLTKGFSQNSIYDYQIVSASGNIINFNDFRGKLILIVNTASASERNTQFIQLDSLCRSYGSDLVVIAFPSNDFLHEPKSNSELQTISAGFASNFFLAAKCMVTGEGISPVYRWCTQKLYNGVMDSEIKADFQKFIINRTGKMIGFYSGRITPIDILITKTLNTN